MTIKPNWNDRATWRWLMIILVVLGTGWIVLSREPSNNSIVDSKRAELPQKGYSAPDFELQTLEGQVVQLSSLRGQVVLINFWATWCPPCRLEMPDIQQVYEQYQDQGLSVLAVNLQEQDAQLTAFVEEMGLTFPILLDRTGRVSNLYKVTSVPTTLFVDREGVIQDRVVGGPLPHALIESKIAALLSSEDGT